MMVLAVLGYWVGLLVLEVFSNKNDAVLSTKQTASSPRISGAVLSHLWSSVQRQSLPSYIMQNKKVWWVFFLEIVSLMPFRGTADLPHLFVCLLYRMLCHKSRQNAKMLLFGLMPAKMKGGVYSLRTLVAGQNSFLECLGFCSDGESCSQDRSLGEFTVHIWCKNFCETERPGSKAVLPGFSSKTMHMGERFLFRPLEHF